MEKGPIQWIGPSFVGRGKYLSMLIGRWWKAVDDQTSAGPVK
jgi:hypothetical protein